MTKSIDEMSKAELRIAIAQRDVIIRSLKAQLVGQEGFRAHPGYEPGSPAHAQYLVIERERSERLVREGMAAFDPLSESGLRGDLMEALDRLQAQKSKNDGG